MTKKIVVPVLIIGLLALAFVWVRGDSGRVHVTAYFDRAISVYKGSEVRILGVPVGEVSSVTPEGDQVKVDFWFSDDHQVPANAGAVIISPSVVGDRYVQLVWPDADKDVSGVQPGDSRMEDGAVIERDQTNTPLELDEIFGGIDKLTVAIGPDGANKNGALSDLIEQTARNYGGAGAQFHDTLTNFSKLQATLATNDDQLFGTVTQLEGFIATLAQNDDTVRGFNQAIAKVSKLLAGERKDLAASLHNLGVAVTEVESFVRENKDALSKNIAGLNDVVKILVKQRAALDEILHVAPLALNNLGGTYNPQTGTLDTRANLGEVINQITSDPGLLLCTVLDQADTSGALCDAISAALPRTSPFRKGQLGVAQYVDPTLGGLVRPEVAS